MVCLTVFIALVVLLVALCVSACTAFLQSRVPLRCVRCCPSHRPSWPCIKCSNSFPFFPLPDPGTGPRQAAGCVCVRLVPVSFVFLSFFPWGLPSPTPGPRAASSFSTCPTLARSPLSQGLPELGITLGTRALSGVCFCNLHLQSSCSPFSLRVVQGLVRGPASCLPTGWPPSLGLLFHLFRAS